MSKSERCRAEIYAVNSYLKKLEQEKFANLRLQYESSQQTFDQDDTGYCSADSSTDGVDTLTRKFAGKLSANTDKNQQPLESLTKAITSKPTKNKRTTSAQQSTVAVSKTLPSSCGRLLKSAPGQQISSIIDKAAAAALPIADFSKGQNRNYVRQMRQLKLVPISATSTFGGV